MPEKDEKIAELEEALEHLTTAFFDAIAVIFAEVNEHAKHHRDEMAEAGITIDDQIEAQAKFLAFAESEHFTSHQIIHAVAKYLGHTPLPSQMSDIGVFTHHLGPGDTLDSVMRAALDNNELPSDIKDHLRTMLNSGQVDQADAKLRDMRNQSNADLN